MQELHRNRSTLAESINRTQSLKKSHPGVDVPASIFSPDDRQSLYSISGDTEQEFDFDDDIVNSKVYRRHLAALRKPAVKNQEPIIEGDLIDSSDSRTIIAGQTEQLAHDLEGLVIQLHDEDRKDSNNSEEKPTGLNVSLKISDSESSPPKKRLGAYTLNETLGEGSQGEVKLAYNLDN